MSDQTSRPRATRNTGRESLLRAISRIVARDGVDALTFRAVAREAGVTHGLAAYHFASREAMIIEALGDAIGRGVESTALHSTSETITDFAAGLPEEVARDPDPHSLQQQLHHLALQRPQLRPAVDDLRSRYLASVSESLGKLAVSQDEDFARLVLACLDGIVLQQLFVQDPALSEAMIMRLHSVLRLVADHGLPDVGGHPT